MSTLARRFSIPGRFSTDNPTLLKHRWRWENTLESTNPTTNLGTALKERRMMLGVPVPGRFHESEMEQSLEHARDACNATRSSVVFVKGRSGPDRKIAVSTLYKGASAIIGRPWAA